MIRPELLAPAGDMKRLKTAVLYGADAVYLGSTEYGMRAAPSNFTLEELAEGVAFAHERNVKIFLTVNTIPLVSETPSLPDFLVAAEKCGVDAFIVADIGVINLCRKVTPNMELHASTQVGIMNELTANALGEMGVKRVVLAREMSLLEIKILRERTNKDVMLESFVHGAMCMSVSGRCTLSNYLTGKDPNRGQCTQPCRWNYALMEEKRPGVYFPIIENNGTTTILSSKDLCMIKHLKDIVEAGVESFKIEGRGKTSYYVAVVTNAYRAALDALMNNEPFPLWTLDELETISHREYGTGFYYGKDDLKQTYVPGGYIHEWELSAMAQKLENGRLYVMEQNKFSEGDTLELLLPGKKPISFVVKDLQNEKGEHISCINHPEEIVSMSYPYEMISGAVIRRKK